MTRPLSDAYDALRDAGRAVTAARLREAAALMRERAEAAGGAAWFVRREASEMPDVVSDCEGESCDGCGIVAAMVADEDAEHIASWHPAVALAVADLLDSLATRAEQVADTVASAERAERLAVENIPGYADAVTLARAYLGSAS